MSTSVMCAHVLQQTFAKEKLSNKVLTQMAFERFTLGNSLLHVLPQHFRHTCLMHPPFTLVTLHPIPPSRCEADNTSVWSGSSGFSFKSSATALSFFAWIFVSAPPPVLAPFFSSSLLSPSPSALFQSTHSSSVPGTDRLSGRGALSLAFCLFFSWYHYPPSHLLKILCPWCSPRMCWALAVGRLVAAVPA